MLVAPRLLGTCALIVAFSAMLDFPILYGGGMQAGLVLVCVWTSLVLWSLKVQNRVHLNDQLVWLFGCWALYHLFKMVTHQEGFTDVVRRGASVGMALAVAVTLRDERTFRAFAYASGALASALAVYGLVVGIENAYTPHFEFSAALDRNLQGWHLAFGFVPLLSYAVASTSAKKWEKVLAYACALLCCVGVLGYRSRSASLACAVALLGVLGHRLTAKSILVFVIVVTAVGGIALQQDMWNSYADRWLEKSTFTGSGRTEILRATLSCFGKLRLDQQLFGASQSAPVILGQSDGIGLEGTHNGYSTILVETGAFGFLAFLAVLSISLWRGLRRPDWTGAATFASGLAFLCMFSTLDLLATQSGWVVLGIMVAQGNASERLKAAFGLWGSGLASDRQLTIDQLEQAEVPCRARRI
jgi:O-antigen ligase